MCLPLCLQAAEFYASPTGSPSGNGSQNNPWDLQTAISPQAGVQPGDTIWLRGGIYTPTHNYCLGFQSWLVGTSNAPIIVRQYPGERAILQEPSDYSSRGCSNAPDILYVVGSYTWYWGFELRSTNTSHITSVSGSGPSWSDLPLPTSLEDVGVGNKFINLIAHDTRGGLGLWTAATNSEAYGCILYNNGYDAPDRGHGHGIYCQNLAGVKHISDNIIFNHFGLGIHGYTEGNFLKHFLLERNIVFNNSRIGQYPNSDIKQQILFGGGTPLQDIKLFNNCIYLPFNFNSTLVKLDYAASSNDDTVVANNYIAGGTGGGGYAAVSAQQYQSIVFTNNLVYSPGGTLLQLNARAVYNVDHNTYYGSGGSDFNNNGSTYPFANWKTATGYDANSTYLQNIAPPNKILVFTNAYEPKRANIVVYNWASSNNVNVDVSSILQTGDLYEVRNAQDYFAAPVRTGTYTGGPISLPMTNLTVAAPTGWTDTNSVPTTGKEFNIFVLLGAAGTPAITQQPANQIVITNQPVTFTVTATGAAPLTYRWQRNGTNITGANSNTYSLATATLADHGAVFRCIVTNAYGTATSSNATLTVLAEQPPVPTIIQPATNALYSGGDTVTYSGTGTDPEDGTLSPSAFTWKVDFYHDGAITPVVPPTSGQTNGTFVIPTTGDTTTNAWYRITLTVRDSPGVTTTVTRDIRPRLSTITLQTVPPGLQVKLDGQATGTAVAVVAVVGLSRTVEAVQQIVGGVSYGFNYWSDGGAAAHTILVPATATVYTAYYKTNTISDQYVSYWNFDAGAGVLATDSGTLANNGTLQPGATWTTGKIGAGTSFDGVVGYVRVGADLSQWLGGTASLSAWIKTTQTGSSDSWLAPGITGVERDASGNDIFWGWLDNAGRICLQAGNGGIARSANAVNDGQWHHIGLTRNATTGAVQVYVDGALSGTATSESGPKTTPFYSLGRIEDTAGTPVYFQGQLDEVRIYNSVLSDNDMAALAVQQASSYLSYWKFDEGTSGLAVDSGTLANDGTLQPGASWTTGKIGAALSFDGGNGYVRVGADLNQWLGGTASMSAWIKTTQTGSTESWLSPGITGVESAGSGNDIFWGWLDNTGRICLQAGNGGIAKSTNPVNDGQWHHIGLTRNAASGAVQVYVDGGLSGTATSETGTKTTAFYSLGRIEDTANSPVYFLGQLDEVRIYNSVLSGAEVASLASQTAGPVVPGTVATAGLNGTSNFGMQFSGSAYALSHAVEASTNLSSWITLTNIAPAGTGPYDFVDPDAALYLRRFYRVRSSY